MRFVVSASCIVSFGADFSIGVDLICFLSGFVSIEIFESKSANSPITSPTLTLLPSLTKILVILPALCAGISIVIFSVSISARLSPALKEDPSDNNQEVRVPSIIDSPSSGTVMSAINL